MSSELLTQVTGHRILFSLCIDVFVVAKSNSITRIDLDAPSLATINPVVGGVRFDGPEISISDAPGLGIENISELSMLSFDKAAAS